MKSNDYAIWLKVCHKADCYLLDEELALYRRRAGSISAHSVEKKILWHYKLFRNAEGQKTIEAVFNTARNIVFGAYKKIRYTRRNKKQKGTDME